MKRSKKQPYWNFDEYFNNLFNEMNSNFAHMRQMFEKGFEGQSKGDSQVFSRSWGYSYQLGPDGIPKIQTWGDIPENFQLPQNVDRFGNPNALSSSVDPTVDIIEEEEELRLIVEVPGIEKYNLDVNVTETEVRIRGSQEDRHYDKKIGLPGKIRPKSAKVSLRNGILEFKAEWKEKSKYSKKEHSKSFNVNID
ncbi:MAG: Hsp20/alpha crystallin family protein [Promethearchaeota archaeon]